MSNLKLCVLFLSCVVVSSCTSKKEILYLQNAEELANTEIPYTNSKIQPNDVLRITVGAQNAEATKPYNKATTGNGAANASLLQLDGYLVSEDLTLNFPILGTRSVADQTTQEFAMYLKNLLEAGNHLKDPTVEVRLLNAKFTVLGEVSGPGTYSFTEQNITLVQALGYAGDLTINGIREDVLIMREEGGVRQIAHIDLTTADWLNGPYNFVKPNDLIYVKQIGPRVKSAGYIGNLGSLLSVASILFTTIVLISK